jgi:hypothetical protein
LTWRRWRRGCCATGTKTFAATTTTPFYRPHKPLDLVTLVLTLLCHGGPRQAMVAAYGLLVRRGRALVREGTVAAGMWQVGCAYNFCGEHDTLLVAVPAGSGQQWEGRTPAMAAKLTDHRWELREVLGERLPVVLPVCAGRHAIH